MNQMYYLINQEIILCDNNELKLKSFNVEWRRLHKQYVSIINIVK